jgi:HEAT repeat protein
VALGDADSDTEPLDDEDPARSALDEALAELRENTAASAYPDLVRRAATEAERARDADSMFRVIDVLAEHVELKETRAAEVARSFLVPLATGAAMVDLLERAARGSGAEQVRAAQVLALVGEPAAAIVLDRMSAYPEPIQRERLVPLLLALGERAAPELLARLDRPERDIARSAAHVLGMLQHPAAVPRLADLAVGPDPLLREEAARALVRIGSEDAVASLARGLRGERAAAISCVQHLAGTASAKAVAPLGHALERALEAKDVELAKEIVRALGRLGRPEANVIFGALMKRKAGLTSRWLKDVKVAAASALGTVPGDQAVALLAEAIQSRDEPLRRAAQRALDRRAEAVARGNAAR